MVKLRCELRTVLWMALVMGLSWFPGAKADLNDGLVAYYPFDGNANDASGKGNHGIEHGGVSYEVGRIGQAASFLGKMDEYIRVPNSDSLSVSDSLTIIAWVKPSRFNFSINPIVTKGYNQEDYTLWLTREGIALLLNWNTPRQVSISGIYQNDSTLPTDTWHFLTATYDKHAVKLYFNGKLILESFASQPIDKSQEDLYIGSSYPGGNEYFSGLIDDLRIYNRALSECEIKSLYTSEDECKPNLVTLNNFTATPFQNDIRVHWKTASEVDNAGFHIWRATGEGWKTGDYSQVIRITDSLIPSEGTKAGGYTYSYVDSNVESGITYYYGLEDIDFNGHSTVHWDLIDDATAK